MFRSRVARFGAALAVFVVATALRFLFGGVFQDHVPFLTYYGAVMFSAWALGLGPTLLTIVASTAVSVGYFLSITGPRLAAEDQAEVLLFLCVSTVTTALMESLRSSQRRAEHRASDAEIAREAATRHEAEFRALVENLPDIIFRLDRSLRHIYISPTVDRMWSLPPEAVLGKTAREAGLPAEFCDPFEAGCREAMETGRSVTCEFTQQTPQGMRYFQSRIIPQSGPSGRIESLLGVTSDLTGWKRAEQDRDRLLQNLGVEHARLQAVLEQMPAGTIIADAPSGRLVMINRQIDAIFRHSTPLAAETVEFRQWKGFHRDGRPYEPGEWPLARSVRLGEVVRDEEIEIERADGSRGFISASSTPIHDREGRVIGAVVIDHDISERHEMELRLRESEQRYRTLFHNPHTCMLLVDPATGQIVDANSAAVAFYGYKFEKLTAMRVTELNLLEAEEVFAAMRQAADQRKDCYQFRHRLADGQIRDVEVHTGPIEVEGRRLLYSIVFDVTDEVLARRQLEEAKRAAEEANQAKSSFLAIVSHELRTPMNAVLGMTELALAEELPASARDCLQTAKDSADALLDILNELLDFARIEAGKFTLEPSPFLLKRLVEDTLKVLSVRGKQKNLELIKQTAPTIPDWVVGDRVRLRQVLVNLIGNAIKFTHHGRVALSVGVISATAEEVELEFAVEDTGIGIPHDQQQRIFDPYMQAHSSTTGNYGGTGLGLAISASIVQMMGGRLHVTSEPGLGSTFRFTARFPICNSLPAPEPNAPVQSEKPSAVRPLRILLAEDTPANQKLVARILSKRGHRIEIAEHGRQAVEMARQGGFDLILMDVQMPVLDGFRATGLIRDFPSPDSRNTPIIAMTAHAMKGDEDRCLKAGMDAYLPKPIDSRQLVELVERLAETAGQSSPSPIKES